MRKDLVDSIIRVDHAGEYAAVCIYHGQELALKGSPEESVIREMKEHEQEHFNYFDNLIKERRVRPTVFLPVWHLAAVGLGYVTAMIGKEAAMACTAAVEEVICEHYDSQVKHLELSGSSDEECLKKQIMQFREDEREHMEEALASGAERAPGYAVLSCAIKAACRLGIAISKVF